LQAAELEFAALHPGRVIVGIDEAGRGPLAGPVVAGAVVLGLAGELPPALASLNDSKKLTEKKREALYEPICEVARAYAVAKATAKEIDTLGILNANFLAMRRAMDIICQKLSMDLSAFHILVDGPLLIRTLPPEMQTPVVKGDGKVACIAAASILAKVSRDCEMEDLADEYPGYGFEIHKGYGTPAHLSAIKRLGPSPIHRMSFAPLKELSLFS
jgi:ribonuclease HII